MLNNQERIEDWEDINLKVSVQVDNKKSRDEIVEYLRFLAWKRVDYKVKPAQFENAKDLFKTIVDHLHEKKDHVSLGYFIYYTQYFYCKEGGDEAPVETKAPAEAPAETQEAEATEAQEEGQEAPEAEGQEKEEAEGDEDQEEEADLLNDDEQEQEQQQEEEQEAGDDKENVQEEPAQDQTQTTEQPAVKAKVVYTMMADVYFTYAFAKDKEFWLAILTQIFNVKNQLKISIRIVEQDCQRNQVTKFSRICLLETTSWWRTHSDSRARSLKQSSERLERTRELKKNIQSG